MREFLAVIVGAVIGTALRLAIDWAIPHTDETFPVSTLIINTVGALALGLLVGRVWPTAPSWLRAGLGAGLLGTFTTFSALAVSLVSLTVASEWMLALLYLVSTMVLGLAAAALGVRLGTRRTPIDLVNE